MTSFSNTASRTFVGFAGLAVGALLCFGAVATPAQARGIDQLPTVTVSYADIDLGSTAGRRELDRRLHTAAHQVCATPNYSIVQAETEQRCVALALAHARSPVVR